MANLPCHFTTHTKKMRGSLLAQTHGKMLDDVAQRFRGRYKTHDNVFNLCGVFSIAHGKASTTVSATCHRHLLFIRRATKKKHTAQASRCFGKKNTRKRYSPSFSLPCTFRRVLGHNNNVTVFQTVVAMYFSNMAKAFCTVEPRATRGRLGEKDLVIFVLWRVLVC
jgi:hypothetical protein